MLAPRSRTKTTGRRISCRSLFVPRVHRSLPKVTSVETKWNAAILYTVELAALNLTCLCISKVIINLNTTTSPFTKTTFWFGLSLVAVKTLGSSSRSVAVVYEEEFLRFNSKLKLIVEHCAGFPPAFKFRGRRLIAPFSVR